MSGIKVRIATVSAQISCILRDIASRRVIDCVSECIRTQEREAPGKPAFYAAQ